MPMDKCEMWSEVDKKMVEWAITREEEVDSAGNKENVIVAKYGEEVHKFSPNTTDEELKARYAPDTSDAQEVLAKMFPQSPS